MRFKNNYIDQSTLTAFLKKRIALLLLVCMAIAASGLIVAEFMRYKNDSIQVAKSETRYHVERAIEFIEHARRYGKRQRYQEMEDKVNNACSIISHLHDNNRNKSSESIQQALLGAISSIKDTNGQNSYFVIDSEGKIIFGDNRSHEIPTEHNYGTKLISEDVILNMARSIKISGEGHFYYDDMAAAKTDALTHAYVKKYEPLNWMVGSYQSLSQHRSKIQQYVRQMLGEISFAQGNGYIFVKSFDGIELVNRTQPQLIGQNIWKATDPNGVKVVQEIVKVSQNPDGGFVDYTWNNPATGKPATKTSYSKGVADWGWAVGTGFYHDDINVFVAAQHDQLKRHLAEHVFIISIIGLLALGWSWWIWKKTSQNLNSELKKFTDFFTQAEQSSNQIDPQQFQYAEFSDLAETINRMVTRRLEDETFRQALLDNLQIGVAVINPETHTVELANPVAAEMFGSTIEDFIGKSCRHLCMSKTAECPMANVEDQTRTKEGQLIRADGKPIPILKSVTWVRVGGRRLLLESFVDMTERHTAQQKLEEAVMRAERLAAEAKQATDAKSEFLSNMSHEIRTPMNGIIGMTELLMDSCESSEQKQYVDMIKSCSEQLLGLINCILDFSKIEAGHLELEMIDYDLLDTVEGVTDILAVKAAEKNLEFSCFVSPEIPTALCGDPGRLRQILINLAGNAIKFTHHGEVVISAILNKETETHVTLQFDVRDTGIGIPADKLGKLFKSFSQVDSSTARKYGGTGLGLAISKQLVEMMDGEISVCSVEAKGTTFSFTVQLKKQENTSLTLPTDEDLSGSHVLIVDDNETNRFILEKYLSSWQVRVEQAESGQLALTKLNKSIENDDPINIVLMDQKMPGMDGFELGRSVTANPLLKNTALVMLSSAGQIKDYENLKACGFAAQMLKPIRRQRLLQCISNINRGLHQNSNTEEAPEMSDNTKNIADLKILLVEDNLANQIVGSKLIEKILTIKPEIANNGLEAIQKLKAQNYDIVFMDCQMPEMDGFEATAQIRAGNTLNSRIPIVAMTANAMKGDRELCIEAGMDDYISKPVSYESISEALERMLNIAPVKS